MEHEGTKQPKSPQQKKALSYVHDARNAFGENDKASRKAIPARKAEENRGSRRKATQALRSSSQLACEKVDVLESSLLHDVERVGGWEKKTDIPLADFIERQKIRRVHRKPSVSTSRQHGTE